MDFWAMQLTPRKKKDDEERREEQLKKIKEHVVTKEELLVELNHGEIKKELQIKETSEVAAEVSEKPVSNPSPNFLSPRSFSIANEKAAVDAEIATKPKENVLEKKVEEKKSLAQNIWTEKPKAIKKEIVKKAPLKSFWPIDENMMSKAAVEKLGVNAAAKPIEAAPIVKENSAKTEPAPLGISAHQSVAASEHKIENTELAIKETPITTLVSQEKISAPTPIVKKEIAAIPSEILPKKENIIQRESISNSQVKEIKKVIAPVVAPIEIKEVEKFAESENDILKKLVSAVLADDEKKINETIEALIIFRAKDPQRAASNHEFNLKLKEKLLATIPALFAYKGGKSVIHVLQLLDEMNIEFAQVDFAKLPNEILKSEEMKGICQKYLLWFAKEYPDMPGQLQDRIYCFNKCEILSYQEIKGFSSLQLAISTDLINFIKENVQDPHDVERKIYEFALAGLIDEKEFRALGKVKDIVRKFIAGLILTKKDRPMEAAKKIDEYEKIGFIKAGEVIADEKIGKSIEKYLVKFKRENQAHPRKASALVKDYFNAGLIDKKIRDRLL